MLAQAAAVAQVFEAIMLICFGISWPIDILKQLRTRATKGKSLGFLSMIVIGYFAGLTAKLIHASIADTWPQPVTWLYLLNAILVSVDIALYLHFSKRQGLGTGE